MPSLKEMVDAYLGHLSIERQVVYVRRGRSFKAKSTFYLLRRYINAVRLYADCADPERAVDELHDLEAEVTLRGEALPSLEVQCCEFSRWRIEHMKRLEAGPDAWRKPERKLVASAMAFFDNSRRKLEPRRH
jgi:hypothetical protein